MLKVDQLQVALDSESGIVRAVDALSISIQRGETFALVGESGCGKSMTALALLRLLPENGVIDQGEMRLAGRTPQEGEIDLMALAEAGMRRVRGGRIGMIFQEPSTSLNPVMRVGDQICEAIETHTKLRGEAARAQAIEWLKRVGIPEPERRIDDYPFRLSGGQKQRVMIAMTLAAEPDFIVADEPTTALDVTIQAQVLDLLRQLQRERGVGLLLITHDLAVVSGMADRVALMYAGQIVEVASAREFFAAPKHPYAALLLAALPDSARKGEALAAIGGTVPALTQSFVGCRFAPRCPKAMVACSTQVPALKPLPLWGSLSDPVRSGDPAKGDQRHAVRCWLHHAPAGGAAAQASAPITSRQGAGGAFGAKGQRTTAQAGTSVHTLTPSISAQASSSAPRTGEPLLTLNQVHVRFPQRTGLLRRVTGHFHAVRGVSLQVPAGRTLALVGESGCGKTTLGKAIVQLLRGVAEVQGQAMMASPTGAQDLFTLEGAALRAARRQVQIVFQDPFASLNPRLRVAEILDEGLASLSPDQDASQRRQRIHELCEAVGLRSDALQRYPHEFSGGQRQRIAIARALAVRPQLLICDEPTSALDVSVQAQILNLLAELQRELGLSYLFITHNLAVVEYLADEVAVMKGGELVEVGPAEEVLTVPKTAYAQGLLAAVPRLTGR